MASLVVTNTFVDGNTIFAAGFNTNFDDIEIYINNRNSGAAAWERVLATNASSVPGVFDNSSGTNDILDCKDNGTIAFRVADGGNVVVGGSGALSTATTTGFHYISSCAGTPTGVPTSFSGAIPTIYDTTNSRLYAYSGSWKNVSNPSVDGSTIEVSGGAIQIKDGLTIQTLNIGTALNWKTFTTLKILQVVQATQNTAANYNSATFVDTTVTVSITPKINTSQIFILTSFTMIQAAGDTGYVTLARNSTNLGGSAGFHTLPASNDDCVTMQYLDSPATTSAITYKVQYRNAAASGSASIPVATNTTAVIMAVEIAA